MNSQSLAKVTKVKTLHSDHVIKQTLFLVLHKLFLYLPNPLNCILHIFRWTSLFSSKPKEKFILKKIIKNDNKKVSGSFNLKWQYAWGWRLLVAVSPCKISQKYVFFLFFWTWSIWVYIYIHPYKLERVIHLGFFYLGYWGWPVQFEEKFLWPFKDYSQIF